MKKQVKKLSLAKDTLTHLDKPALLKIQGGSMDTTCPCFDGSWCACSGFC